MLSSMAILAAAVPAASCAEESAPEEPVDAAVPDAIPHDFAVRGSATGLLGPVALVADADAVIELTCTAPALASVVVSGIAPAVTLVPGMTDYVVDLPLLQPTVALIATVAMDGDTLTIAGTPTASGTPSAKITLNLGDNLVDIVVENALGWQRTYRLTLRRAAQIAQYAYGKASNTGDRDEFGISVTLAGDTLAVGAWRESSAATGVNGNQEDDSAQYSGAVYVFRRTGTVWQQEAYLKASNPDANDRFGISVALMGDTLAVGAYDEDSAARGVDGDQYDNSALASGAVYVFRRTGTTWQQEAYIKASNTGAVDHFGCSVSLSGDTLAVGAFEESSAAQGVDGDQDNNLATDSGAVYVFRRSDTTWQQEAYIKASNAGAGDYFGRNVALSGDILAVGAHAEDSAAQGVGGNQDDNSAASSGAVYVFRRSGTTWQQEAYLKGGDTDFGDNFGYSVALFDDTLAVGARNAAEGSGAVYMFRRSGTDWEQEVHANASNPDISDNFGISVALSGDTIAAGASGEDSAARGVNGNQDENSAFECGAVYIFH